MKYYQHVIYSLQMYSSTPTDTVLYMPNTLAVIKVYSGSSCSVLQMNVQSSGIVTYIDLLFVYDFHST